MAKNKTKYKIPVKEKKAFIRFFQKIQLEYREYYCDVTVTEDTISIFVSSYEDDTEKSKIFSLNYSYFNYKNWKYTYQKEIKDSLLKIIPNKNK